jgi:hypothetical protein
MEKKKLSYRKEEKQADCHARTARIKYGSMSVNVKQ